MLAHLHWHYSSSWKWLSNLLLVSMQIFSAFLTPMHTVSNTVTGKCRRNCSQTWEFLAVQGWKTGHAVGTIAIKSNYLVVNGFFKWDRCSWRNFCYFYRVQCCWYALIWSIDRVELAAPSCPPAASTFILLNTDLHCKVNAMWWDHESTSKDYLRGFVFLFLFFFNPSIESISVGVSDIFLGTRKIVKVIWNFMCLV